MTAGFSTVFLLFENLNFSPPLCTSRAEKPYISSIYTLAYSIIRYIGSVLIPPDPRSSRSTNGNPSEVLHVGEGGARWHTK